MLCELSGSKGHLALCFQGKHVVKSSLEVSEYLWDEIGDKQYEVEEPDPKKPRNETQK